MSTRTLGALGFMAACALSSTALAQDPETAPVSLSADTNASANTSAPSAAPLPYRARPRGEVGPWRIMTGMHFGFAGELDTDVPAGVLLLIPEAPDLEPTIGLHAGVEYLLMEYFALGGELRLSWWKPVRNIVFAAQSDPDRSLYVDINVKPRGRYAFSSIPLEVYGTLPLGLSVASINDDLPMEGGPGFNLGFGGGATYFITPRIGVNAELLGVWHWFDGKLNVGPDTDNRTAQLYWFLNAVFAI